MFRNSNGGMPIDSFIPPKAISSCARRVLHSEGDHRLVAVDLELAESRPHA